MADLGDILSRELENVLSSNAVKEEAPSSVALAKYIVTQLNAQDTLGVKFRQEGDTIAVANLDQSETSNLLIVDGKLSDDERRQLFGGNIDIKLTVIPNGKDEVPFGRLSIDTKNTDTQGIYSAFSFFIGTDGNAPALKAAITTGNIDEVRKKLGTEGQPPAQQLQQSGASEPAASAPERNPGLLEQIKEKLPSFPAPSGGTPSSSDEPQSMMDKPIDVAALATELGLKVPSAEAQTGSAGAATYGGTAKARTGTRDVS